MRTINCKKLLILFIIVAVLFTWATMTQAAETIIYMPGETKNTGIDSTGGVQVVINSPADVAATETGNLTGNGTITIEAGINSGFPTLKLRGNNTGFSGILSLNAGTLNIGNVYASDGETILLAADKELIAKMSDFKFNSNASAVYSDTQREKLGDLLKDYAANPTDAGKIALDEALALYDLAMSEAHASGTLAVMQIASRSNVTINGNGGTAQRITVNTGKAGSFVLDSGVSAAKLTTMTFTGHVAGAAGGAVIVEANGILKFSAGENAQYLFSANQATSGGAILNAGLLSLGSAVFNGNIATTNGGGAIANVGLLHISNTGFSGNISNQAGGAIYNAADGYAIISNATFTGNKVNNGGSTTGGAIYNTGVMTISGSTFGNATNAAFTNTATHGGAIYSTGAKANLNILNSTFTNNSGSQHGSAIYIAGGDFNITGTRVENSTSINGNFYLNAGKGTINDGFFTDNTATFDNSDPSVISDGGGGAIYVMGGALTVSNTVFERNKATGLNAAGGAVVNHTVTAEGLIIQGSRFTGNEATVSAGAIANFGKLKIINSEFTGNIAPEKGGSVFNFAGGALTVEDSTFSANISSQYGSGLTNQDGSVVLENTTFRGNYASVWGGAVYNEIVGENAAATININNSRFENNSSLYHGGAIYNKGKLKIENSVFSGNFTTDLSGSELAQGGAIYNLNGTMDISDAVFENNSSTQVGGGAIFSNNGSVTIARSAFTDNTVKTWGGAISATNGTLTIVDSQFIDNIAGNEGGAIAFGGAGTLNLEVSANSTFLFSGNRKDSGATLNSISLMHNNSTSGNLVLNIKTNAATAVMDMRDPIYAATTAQNVIINKTGAGAWRLGGTSNFETSGTGIYNFTVSAGTLRLYGGNENSDIAAGIINIKGTGSSFALAGGAMLRIGGDNAIHSDGGLTLTQNSVLGFDLANFTAATVGLKLSAGQLNIINGSKLNFYVDVLSWNTGTFTLIEAADIDFSDPGLNYDDAIRNVTGTPETDDQRFLIFLRHNENNIHQLQLTFYQGSALLNWTGAGLNMAWNGMDENWAGTRTDVKMPIFYNGDVVNFDSSGTAVPTVGLTIDSPITVSGMFISGNKDIILRGSGITADAASATNISGMALSGQLVLGAYASSTNYIRGPHNDNNIKFTGTLDLTGITGVNDFKKGVVIDSGTLKIANASQLGTTLDKLIFTSASANGATLLVAKPGSDPHELVFDGLGGATQRLVVGQTATNMPNSGFAGTITLADKVTFTIKNNVTTANGGAIALTNTNAALALNAGDGASFKFTGNQANSGGAILNTGTLTIAKAEFSHNTATTHGYAIYNTGTLVLNGGSFANNNSITRGGAIFNSKSGATALTLTVADVLFSGNSSEGGGAIYSNSGGIVEITASSFTGNSSSGGGGAIAANGTLNIKNSSFTGNTAGQEGGAIVFYGNGSLNLEISGNQTSLFSGNTANGIANSIVLGHNTVGAGMILNVKTDNGGALDMRDPLTGLISNVSADTTITKTGSGIWKLGGVNTLAIDHTSSGKYIFTVNEGTLYLYREGEANNATAADASAKVGAGSIAIAGVGSSFTLGANATLKLGGGNAISTTGTINMAQGSVLAFDMANYIARGQNGATTVLGLSAGTFNIASSAKLNFAFDFFTWNNGEFLLIDSNNYDFSQLNLAATDLRYAQNANNRRYARLYVTSGAANQLYVKTTDNANLALTWTGLTDGTVWESARDNWQNALDNVHTFLDGDSILFTANNAGVINIANNVTVSGMRITGGSYTFNGGSITGIADGRFRSRCQQHR